MKITIFSICMGLVISLGGMTLSLDATAQTASKLEEIVVTSQRREENLQDVPISVTALGEDTIDRADISSPIELSTRIPGFTFAPFNAGQAIFSLRGISSNDDGAGTENSVAVFLDDVYFGRVSNAAFDFFDLERIEVLRGPQGTQFGRNAIGGAINITSIKPALDGVRAKVKTSIGNYSTQNFAGYVTGPLSDNLAAKVSFATRNRDGFVTNILTGNDLKDQGSSSFRGQLLYVLNNTEITLTAAVQDEENNDIARMPLKTAGVRQFFDAAGGSKKKLRSATPQEGFSDRGSDVFSLKAQHAFANGGELTSVTSYYETRSRWEMDSAGVPEINVVDDIRDATDAFTQELRYSQGITDNIDLLLGAFYLHEKTDRSEFFRFVNHNFAGLTGVDDRTANRPADDPDDAVGGYRQINKTDSYAGFFHANWQFAENWSISLGGRLTHDSKKITSSGFASGSDPTNPELTGFIINENFGDVTTGMGIADSASFTNFSPKASLNWQANDDLLLYASYSRGFKSGGFGAAPPNAMVAANIRVKPEIADSYEIGLKGDFFDSSLRLNIAGFYLKYDDLQLQRFGPSLIVDPMAAKGFANDPEAFGFFSTINVGSADVFGFEGEATWIPLPGLTFNASYSFLDTEAEFNFRTFFTGDLGRDFIITEELNRAPKHKVFIAALYEYELAENYGSIVWSGDWRYTSKRRASVVSDDTFEEAYNISDTNISWISADETWEVSFWVKNVFDERYFSHVYTIGPGEMGTLGEPRIYGGSLTWRFN